MAKVQLGPLAASVSGSVGQLTFARTKHGQIIQGKPTPPYPGSPDQQSSIDRFRKANRAYWHSYPWMRDFLKRMADDRNEVQTAAWVSSFCRWLNGAIWNFNRSCGLSIAFEITNIAYNATNWCMYTNLDADPPAYSVAIYGFMNGNMSSIWNGRPNFSLKDPPYELVLGDLSPPFDILAFSYEGDWLVDPLLGFSSMYHVT